MDDHSRFIVGIRYTKLATTEVAISLLNKAKSIYGKPREVLSDRGTQFYAPLGEKSVYGEYLKNLGINHILASIKKPTTTGKLERFWLTHNKERWNFNSLQNFIEFYNYKRPQCLLTIKHLMRSTPETSRCKVIIGHHIVCGLPINSFIIN